MACCIEIAMTYRVFHRPYFLTMRIAAWCVLFMGAALHSGCGWPGTYNAVKNERQARALVLPTLGSTVRGSVLLIERARGMQISYNFSGLHPAQTYAFEIHAQGDCNAADGSSAGSIFTLRAKDEAVRADLSAEKYQPEGVLPKLHADIHGMATGFMLVPELTLGGLRSVVGRSIVVRHDVKESRNASQPYASSSRLACGVIRP